MSNAKTVLEDLRAFEQRRRAILSDSELSDEGVQNRLKSLKAEGARYRSEALTKLKQDWQILRNIASDLAVRRSKAERAEAERWDFEALGYHAEAAKNAIKSAPDFESVRQMYEQASSSGDSNKSRAWAEVTSSLLSERFGSGQDKFEANRLTKRMSEDLARLLDTKALAAVRKSESLLPKQAVELRDATLDASKYYSEPGDDLFGQPDEFLQLMDGIEIGEGVDTQTLAYTYSLRIDEPEPAG